MAGSDRDLDAIVVEEEHRRTAEALARLARAVAAELLPADLELRDFAATLERLAETAPAGEQAP